MRKNVGASYIKDKFSNLLSKLVGDAKLSCNEITDRLIESDFLDMFEKNDISPFYDKSYEALIYDLFQKEVVFSNELETDIYWCGIQYMNLFFNKRIPLKQLFVLCPLQEMRKYYNVYHEQNESKLIDVFMKKEYSNSILKVLRVKRGYSFRQLSLLTDISENTLKYYEINDNLYKASFANVSRILFILNYSDSITKRKSDYVPSFVSLLENNDIKPNFEAFIHEYYNTKDKVEYKLDGFWLMGKKKRLINKKTVDLAILYAIDQYKGNKLLF